MNVTEPTLLATISIQGSFIVLNNAPYHYTFYQTNPISCNSCVHVLLNTWVLQGNLTPPVPLATRTI